MKIKHLIALVAICLLGGGNAWGKGAQIWKSSMVAKQYHGYTDDSEEYFGNLNGKLFLVRQSEESGKVYGISKNGTFTTKYIDDWTALKYPYFKFGYQEEAEGYMIQLVNQDGESQENCYLDYGWNDETGEYELRLLTHGEAQGLIDEGFYSSVWYVHVFNPDDAENTYYILRNMSEWETPLGEKLRFYEPFALSNPKAGFGTDCWDVEESDFVATDDNFFKSVHNGTMTQTLKDMPVGKYNVRLSVKAVGYEPLEDNRISANVIVYINDKQCNLPIDLSTVDDLREYTTEDFTLDEIGNITVTIVASDSDDDEATYIEITNIELAGNLYESRYTSEGRYGTICLPYDFYVENENAHLYTINGIDSEGYLELNDLGSEGEAGVPYIYCATSNGQTFIEKNGANVKETPMFESFLQGSYKVQKVPAGGYQYVLQTQNDIQAFYKVSSDNINCGAYKCWLYWDNGSVNGRAFLSFFEEETAVNALNAITCGSSEIYDLNGNKQETLKKGINIVNGAKVLVK